jgi:hypothetical protein
MLDAELPQKIIHRNIFILNRTYKLFDVLCNTEI